MEEDDWLVDDDDLSFRFLIVMLKLAYSLADLLFEIFFFFIWNVNFPPCVCSFGSVF